MSSARHAAPPRLGTIVLRSHGDCFLHATSKWLSYWNFNLVDVSDLVPDHLQRSGM